MTDQDVSAKELVVFIAVVVMLVAAGYFFVVYMTQHSAVARILGLILALAALFVSGKLVRP